MNSPIELAAGNRRELIARERTVTRDLVAFYGETLARVRRELDELRDLIDQARALDDITLRRRLTRREARLELFEQRTRAHLLAFANYSLERITWLQGQAVGQASGDGPEMIRSSMGEGAHIEFVPPSPDVPARVVGLSGDGMPLSFVLQDAAGEAAALARRELVVGVIRGKGPREIARNITRAAGVAKHRSLLIARTEVLRAYRLTTLDLFQRNQNVVAEWAWQCTYDTRTCAACWAMSGTTHSLDEPLNSHPGCRCSMLPRTRSWEELGFKGIPDTRPQVPSGVDVFNALPDADKLAILGPGKLAAYRDGRITLPDLVKRTRSPRWGPGRRERSLRDALAMK